MSKDSFDFQDGKIYAVRWNDHHSLTGAWQQNNYNGLEPVSIRSVGFCVAHNDEVVRIAGHLDPDNSFSGEITIMQNCITEAWELVGV